MVQGVSLEALRGGDGETVLVLHDVDYVNEPRPFLEILAREYSVLAPSHPGFGASDLPEVLDRPDDIAYLYLDLLDEIGPAHVVGAGFGGWIAAEMAVRCDHNIRSLVLVDAVGIKTAGRETAEIADTFVMNPVELLECTWHDPVQAEAQMKLPGLGTNSEAELRTVLRNRESAALFGWNPFMHNPKLRRQLHRIKVPTLVLWGKSDRVVGTDYGRAYAESITGARFEIIVAAGHYPQLEQPEQFVELVATFLKRD